MEDSSPDTKTDPQDTYQDEKQNGELENLRNEERLVSNGAVAKRGSNADQLQKKLERRIEKAWNNKLVDQQPKKSTMLPIGRLPVPNKIVTSATALVTWDSDSENEFEYSPLASNENTEINQQLLGGQNVDNSFEDDDLDLIPPRAIVQRCICCHFASKTCSIQ